MLRWIASVAVVVAYGLGVATARARGDVPLAGLRGESSTPRVGGSERRSAFADRYEALRTAELRRARRADSILAGVPSTVPVAGARLTGSFTATRFHPILRRVRPHWGVDLAAPEGTPVRAAARGAVIGAMRHPTYGLVVDVRHGREYTTRYAHLSAILVNIGDDVVRGEAIGRVGSTGLTTGPQLHYELFVNGRRRDPVLLFDSHAADQLLP